MRNLFRVALIMAALLTVLLTAVRSASADTADRTFRSVTVDSTGNRSTDGSPIVEIGRGLDVSAVVRSFRDMYRESTKTAAKPDGEELTWQIIQATNPQTTIPVCRIPQDGNMWLGRGNTSIWQNCPEVQRYVGLIAGASGRIRIPITTVETFDQKMARLAEQDACLKNADCLKERLARLEEKPEPAPVATPKAEPTPPKKDPLEAETEAVLADNVRLRAENAELHAASFEAGKRPGWNVVGIFAVLALIVGGIGGRAIQAGKTARFAERDTIPAIAGSETGDKLAELNRQKNLYADRCRIAEDQKGEVDRLNARMGEKNNDLSFENGELKRKLGDANRESAKRQERILELEAQVRALADEDQDSLAKTMQVQAQDADATVKTTPVQSRANGPRRFVPPPPDARPLRSVSPPQSKRKVVSLPPPKAPPVREDTRIAELERKLDDEAARANRLEVQCDELKTSLEEAQHAAHEAAERAAGAFASWQETEAENLDLLEENQRLADDLLVSRAVSQARPMPSPPLSEAAEDGEINAALDRLFTSAALDAPNTPPIAPVERAIRHVSRAIRRSVTPFVLTRTAYKWFGYAMETVSVPGPDLVNGLDQDLQKHLTQPRSLLECLTELGSLGLNPPIPTIPPAALRSAP